MDFVYDHDISYAVDMAEMGFRPLNWLDETSQFFDQEKTVDLIVYSARFQNDENSTKFPKDDDTSSMSDGEDEQDNYAVDPETGERIFRPSPIVDEGSAFTPNSKWVEEYLLNLESSSQTQLPVTTADSNDFRLEDVPPIFLSNSPSDWLANLIQLDETAVSSSILRDNEGESSNGSSTSESIREIDNEITLLETKLEKIEPEDNPITTFGIRSTRLHSQGHQDEELLNHYRIPLTLHDITQSSTEEYNQYLARLTDLTDEQVHIIKDIRRRGKNKIAAQNCRKRKAVGVDALLEEVDELKRVKHELEQQKKAYQEQIAETRRQFEYLHRQVLPNRQLPPAIAVQ